MPVTILDLARHRLGLPADHAEPMTGGDFYSVGLDIIGGCAVCGATCGAYNACPSKSGFWKCADGCIGSDGWETVEEADADIEAADDPVRP